MGFSFGQARAKCRELGIPQDRQGLARAFKALAKEKLQAEDRKRAKAAGGSAPRMPAWQKRAWEREKARQEAQGLR